MSVNGVRRKRGAAQPSTGAGSHLYCEHMFASGFSGTGLNCEQQAAATHGDGPLLVVAGAGTGKTKTLAARLAFLLSRGVPAERVLLLTFSRRAAAELVSRAARAGGRDAGRAWGGTFHAIANRLLRLHGRALGLAPGFTVLDQADAADLMNLVRSDLGLAARAHRFPRKQTLATIYARMINASERLSDVVERDFPWCKDDIDDIAKVFEAYTARKRVQQVLDFDDLLVYLKVLLEATDRGPAIAGMFDHVLVDEYQDTNPLQADILVGLRTGNDNITVVGDDAQAIYSFRSATVRNILDFPQRFPGTTIIKLERNYRATQPLLDVSNAVIALARERHDKELKAVRPGGRRPMLYTCLDEAEQCALVCEHLLEARERGVELKRQAVLFRTGHHSAVLEIELARRNIPFVKFGGLRFLEAAHVKDTLALLRVLENPRDEIAWFRVLGTVQGVGPATAARVMEHIGVRSARPGHNPLAHLLAERPPAPAAAAQSLDDLRAALEACAREPQPPVSEQIESLRSYLEPAFARLYEDAAARTRDLDSLAQAAAAHPARSRFLAELTLDPPRSTADLAGPPLLDDDYVVLSTIHSAKGGEWDAVHVIHAADGMIPSDMALGDPAGLEEERRLFYVALTRARDELYVYFPLRYYHRRAGFDDAHGYAQLTRFLPRPVRALFDTRSGPSAAADNTPCLRSSASSAAALDAHLDALWRA